MKVKVEVEQQTAAANFNRMYLEFWMPPGKLVLRKSVKNGGQRQNTTNNKPTIQKAGRLNE